MAYLFWFILGGQYAYLGKWGIQILYWLTLGGLGIWALIDLFTIPSKVNAYNAPIFQQLDELERREKDEDHFRNKAMLEAVMASK